MSALTREEMRAVYSYVMKRARTDRDFRHALLFSPKQALEQEFDLDLPDHFNIRFVENNGADLTLVLPDLEPLPDEPLSEYDLGYVAGGTDPYMHDIFMRLFDALPTQADA